MSIFHPIYISISSSNGTLLSLLHLHPHTPTPQIHIQMRTRNGVSYPSLTNSTMDFLSSKPTKRTNSTESSAHRNDNKKSKNSPENAAIDSFDALPDDLLSFILSKLGSSASSPSDFATSLILCKRFHGLGRNPIVLAQLSPRAFSVKASHWSKNAHRFLKICADAGNTEARYTLGMIRFYCLQNRGSGASLMAKAAISSHAQSLYSLAVIQFNGSGGLRTDRDLRAGVALCARAASLGHVDALRELGHCLQDGYGVPQNIAEGRRFLLRANAKELFNYKTTRDVDLSAGVPMMSDFGFDVPLTEAHPASRFLAEWFAIKGEDSSGMTACSHAACGRVETRRHEFRRCSVCGKVRYCSRACQALDWKVRHKADCARWLGEVNGGGGGDLVVVEAGGGEVNGES